MTIIVTGAAGFIGAHVAQSLADSGENVIGVDNFNDYYSKVMKQQRVAELLSPSGVEVLDLDLADNKATEHLIANVEPKLVMHFAAQAGVRIPQESVNKYVQSNLIAFSNVLTQCVRHEVADLLYASSSSVYGNSKFFPLSENDLGIRPVSFYGATKRSNEIMAPTLIRNSATRSRGLRYFTVYGPWGRPDMAYLRLINSALNGHSFNLLGDGLASRDFTYIDDVVASTTHLYKELTSRSPGFSDVVNVGGGNPYSMDQMITEVSDQIGQKIKINYLDMHGNDVLGTKASTDYIYSLTGTFPTKTLREGLRSVIKWASSPVIRQQLNGWIQSTI